MTKNIKIILLLVLPFVIFALVKIGKNISKINEDINEKTKNEEYQQKLSHIEEGKYIGRNAALIYIGRHQKEWKSDTSANISIEMIELLNIEDSLSNAKFCKPFYKKN